MNSLKDPITLITLIDMYADLRELCGLRNAISFDEIKNNLPRKYRYLQVQSISNAYQMGTVEEFHIGSFADHKPGSDESDTILTFIFNDSIKNWPWIINEATQPVNHSHDFSALFNRALELRLKLEELVKFNKNVFGSYGIYQYAVVKSEELLGSKVPSMINDVNCFLNFLIDPHRKKRRIRMETLIRYYNYPDMDIKSPDVEAK